MTVEAQSPTEEYGMNGLHPKAIEEINNLPTPEDNRELSPLATGVTEAANRVASFLETRAMNSAHSDALKEYADRDHAGYTDHLSTLAVQEVPNDIAATEQQQSFAQDTLNREARKAERQETFNKARKKVRGFGIVALGLGIIAGAAAGRAVKNGVNTAIDKGASASAALDSKVESAFQFVDGKKVEYTSKIESAMLERSQASELKAFDKKVEKNEKAQAKVDRKEMKEAEKIDKRHDRILRGIKARERRAARREAFKAVISESYQSTKASVLGNIAEAKGAGKEVLRYSKQRTRELGHTATAFISVAQETGQAALDTGRANWKTLREQDKMDRK